MGNHDLPYRTVECDGITVEVAKFGDNWKNTLRAVEEVLDGRVLAVASDSTTFSGQYDLTRFTFWEDEGEPFARASSALVRLSRW